MGYNDDVNDILDNLDVMSDEMENIFNADLEKGEKKDYLYKIRDRIGVYHDRVVEDNEDMDSSSMDRIEKSFDYVKETFEIAIASVQSGIDNADFNKFEEDKSLKTELESEFFEEAKNDVEDIYDEYVMNKDDYELDDANIIDEVQELYPEDYDEDNSVLIQEALVSEMEGKDASNYNFILPLDIQSSSTDNIQSNDFNGVLQADDYFDTIDGVDNPLYQAILEDVEKEQIPFFDSIYDKIPEKTKKQIPLNLKLYQRFYKLMKENDKSLKRSEINSIWKENRNAYIDMLMDTVEKCGGDLLNPQHYINVFENLGRLVAGSLHAGAIGNKFYQERNEKEFDRRIYDKKNNPYGTGKTHSSYKAPQRQEPTQQRRSPPQEKRKWYQEREGGPKPLSDPEAWTDSFENIGTGVYEMLSDISDLLKPLASLL